MNAHGFSHSGRLGASAGTTKGLLPESAVDVFGVTSSLLNALHSFLLFTWSLKKWLWNVESHVLYARSWNNQQFYTSRVLGDVYLYF